MTDIIHYLSKKVFRFNIYTKFLKGRDSKARLVGSVYGKDSTLKEYVKEQNRIHHLFKYIIFVPSVSLCRIVLGKYLVKDVPDMPQFTNLRLFDKAFNDTLIDWVDKFKIDGIARPQGWFTKIMNGLHIKTLKTMKRLMFTVVKNDTAYLELLNILMFNISKEMHNKHGNNPTHLFYTGTNINDPKYYIALQAFKDRIVVEPVKESPEAKEYKKQNGL